MAEQEGFEPSIRGYRIHTFQACAFDHSATAPRSRLAYRIPRHSWPREEAIPSRARGSAAVAHTRTRASSGEAVIPQAEAGTGSHLFAFF